MRKILIAFLCLFACLAQAADVTNNPISPYTPKTSWTPTDASGAALTFTGVSANYTQIGNMVFAYATLTYPSTADGSSAVLGGLPVNIVGSNYGRQCSLTYSNIATAVHLLPTAGTAQIGLFTVGGAAVTNAQMSTGAIFFLCTYPFQ